LADRLLRRAGGTRWRLSANRFAEALAASASRALAGRNPAPREIESYLSTLHLADLALACACAEGSEDAWEHFVREQRPVLYRSADALEAGGGARDLADSLYAELFGVGARGDERPSLFRHYHGRSSLATWLRAVLAQRYVDRMRARQRLDPLPAEETAQTLAAAPPRPDPDRQRQRDVMARALAQAVAALPPRERLRLGCYYAEGLTLAQTGRLLGEHEASASRRLARTRKTIRTAVERVLRGEGRLTDAQITQCFAEIAEDPGTLDLSRLLDEAGRKEEEQNRSKDRGGS
jgi:RNA polymerase sigma-70 factor (ECF subfamily)